MNFKCPEGQIARWLQELQQYDFVVEYRRGVKHSNADALSRRPCLLDRCKYCERLEAKEELQKNGEHIECINECFSCQLAGYGIEGATLNREELRTAQGNDRDLGPVMRWMKESKTRPPWQAAAPYNEITKAYWSQWDSLQLIEGCCSDDGRLRRETGLSSSWCCPVICNHRSCINFTMPQQLVILVLLKLWVA